MRNNIRQRREYIKRLIANSEPIDYRAVAKRFHSSPPAILNDISVVTVGTTAYKKKQTTGQNTRARKLGVPGTLDEQDWAKALNLHNHTCANCGSPIELCIDHVHPLSRGGTNTGDNIQPLCRSCNSKKGSKVQ